jgi:hypothetical protein
MSLGNVAEFFLAKSHDKETKKTDIPAVILQPNFPQNSSRTPDERRKLMNERARLQTKKAA